MPKQKNQKKRLDLWGVILLTIAILVFLSIVSYDPHDVKVNTTNPNVPLTNNVGFIGAWLAWSLLFSIGKSAYMIPLLLGGWALSLFFDKQVHNSHVTLKILGTILAVTSLATMLAMAMPDPKTRMATGGLVGSWLAAKVFVPYLGTVGSYVIASMILILAISLATDFLFIPFMIFVTQRVIAALVWCKEKLSDMTVAISEKINAMIASFQRGQKQRRTTVPRRKPQIVSAQTSKTATHLDEQGDMEDDMDEEYEYDEEPQGKSITIVSAQKKRPSFDVSKKNGGDPPKVMEMELTDSDEELSYIFPSVDILEEPCFELEENVEDEIHEHAEILLETLQQFNVAGEVTRVNNGPVLTTYEFQPAPGIKINSILNLADDLALALKATSIRMIAPIPGKSTVGIEIPNRKRHPVFLRDLVESDEFQNASSVLMVALGKDIFGMPLFGDLTAMPHLLIAGATNSGKTVCVNTIILSLLFRASPQDLKLLLIDPKMVELIGYNGIPHLIHPVITDAKKVPAALNWLLIEMERRYTLFSKIGVRNITGYYRKYEQYLENAEEQENIDAKIDIEKNLENGEDRDEGDNQEKEGDASSREIPLKRMPYIVCVIDELADLMMVASQEVETSITRLAQLARAVGIHLILATQRPSVDVVTGLIKANFPTRISFKVSSKTDSRTILDANGADKLLGRGDMLYLPPGAMSLTRAQCAFVSDQEIENVIAAVRNQGIAPNFDETITTPVKLKTGALDSSQDELYDDAVDIVLQTEQASASLLQRRMRIGYARAARLIDMMEMNSIVSEPRGSKGREVLVSNEDMQQDD